MSDINNFNKFTKEAKRALIIAQEKDNIRTISPDLSTLADDILLDVRTEDEFGNSPLAYESVKIPQDQLSNKINILDVSKPIHVICRRGPRSNEAVRFLKSKGVEQVDYIGGGTAMIMSEEDDE